VAQGPFGGSNHLEIQFLSRFRALLDSQDARRYLPRRRLGGPRNFAFSEADERQVESALWRALEANPTGMLDEFAASILQETNLRANSCWIDRCLVGWGFSRKIALYKQILKYTLRSILYYATFVAAIPGIDPMRLTK
jgi:hypothetical protein